MPGSNYGYSLAQYAYLLPYLGITAPHNFVVNSTNAAEVAQYEGQYKAYLDFLGSPVFLLFNSEVVAAGFATALNVNSVIAGQPTLTILPPTTSAEMANPLSYVTYLANYENVFNQMVALNVSGKPTGYLPFFLQPPPAALGPVIGVSTITIGSVLTDNSPSPAAVPGNVVPLLAASPNGGSSASFRIVAGAALASATPPPCNRSRLSH